ncbi:MAG: type II toxin-antitoxin system RatA family toxin [Alphaproteobacteria bacterium]|nr:type II toxin-antitoxin system RatA family toxin [Alphaproteobacteria bacterium]
MPTHAEQRFLAYSQDKLFALVADVERYPEFLPWCIGCRVTRRDGSVIWADLIVGFKMIREQFTSKVTLMAPDRIDVEYQKGPFKYLNNHWKFIPGEGGCTIDFYIDFEFRSRLLKNILEPLFNEAVKRMVRAFETRAHALYGDDAASSAGSPAGTQK